MEKGILNIDTLEKDISKINFYASEEKKTLLKIYKKMEECSTNYNSTNKQLFLSNIFNFIGSVEKIANKRSYYTVVLRNVVNQYISQSKTTTSIFKEQDFNGGLLSE